MNEGGFAPKKNLLCATLWLRVENNNKFIRRKKRVREAIERYCLNQYNAKRLQKDGWEWEGKQFLYKNKNQINGENFKNAFT